MRKIVSPLDGFSSPLGRLTSFSVLSLFASGEVGAWYDPSDFNSYMAGRGSELASNGDFSSGTGWTLVAPWTIGSGVASHDGSSTTYLQQNMGLVTGTVYELIFDVVSTSGGELAVFNNTATTTYANYTIYTTGTKNVIFTASSSGIRFYNKTAAISIDNVSVKEVTSLSNCTMFQDSAGTTPVTAVEQPVGKILDKSGRGNHASQATTTSRPILRQEAGGQYYLAFDGVDDSLATASIDFSGTDKVGLFAGVRKVADGTSLIAELTASWISNASAFALYVDAGASQYYASASRGSAAVNANQVATAPIAYIAPRTDVLSAQHDIAGNLSKLRVNQTDLTSATGSKGTGNFANAALYISRRGGASLPFNGRLYGLVIRGATCSDAQISSTEKWLNGKTGAY